MEEQGEKMAENVVEVIKENEALVGGTDDKKKSITFTGGWRQGIRK